MRYPTSVIPCLALAGTLLKLPVPNSLAMPPEGLEDHALERLAASMGLEVDVVQGENLGTVASRPLKGPVVLPLKDGRAVLFVGRVQGKAVASIMDPMRQPIQQVSVAFSELEKAWTGQALLLAKRALPHRHVHALVSIAREYGKDLATEDLIHTYVLEGREPDQDLFLRMIGDQGLEGHTAPAGLDELAQMPAGLPFVLHCHKGGLLILWQIAGDALEVENPDRPHLGRMKATRADIEPLLDGRVTFIKAGEQGAPDLVALPKKFGISFFLSEIRHMWGSLGEVGVAAIAIQLLGLATPLFFQVIIDRVVTHQAVQTLHIIGIGMLAAIGFECFFGWLRSYVLLFVTSVLDQRLSIRTFEHLAALPLPFFERTPSGVIIKHMQQPERIREFLTGRVFGALLDCASLIVVLPILLAYSWRLTLVVLFFSGLSALVIFLAMGPFRRRLQDLYATDGERQAFLVESIRAMPTIKSLSLEQKQRKGWNERTALATGMKFRVAKMGISIRAFMQIIHQGMMLCILWWGVYQVFDAVLTVGALVAFNMYSQRVSGPLLQLAGLIQQYQEAGVSLRMLGQIMDEAPETGGARGVLPHIHGRISAKNITFRYSRDGAPALADVSFDVEAGKTLGIVGRSGSGKSTLTRLIQRLQPMQEGDIWLDGHNIRDIDMVHLRRSIGVVLQENFLFRGRVRDNIAVTRPTASLEDIQHAARMAAAHDFIQKLPGGYDTVLEEGGANLSGGQRQRLAIARALLTNPRLMIFDEATSALDPESEAEIQKNITDISAGRTMIIVSHRLSMLRHADCILVLEHGRLVGKGTHDELYARCPQYAALWDRQNQVLEGAA